MLLYQALQYPFQGQGWFKRLFFLVLLQLVPVIGQLILLGYGLAVVRALHAGEQDLPPIKFFQTLGDGFRLFLAGLIYVLPILITIVMVEINNFGSSLASGNWGIFLSIGIAVLVVLGGALFAKPSRPSPTTQSHSKEKRPSAVLTTLAPILVMALLTLLLNVVVSISGIEHGAVNALSISLIILLLIVIFFIGIAACIGGARYAIENKGLFAPTVNAKLLLQHRSLTGMLLLNVFLLTIFALITTSLGLLLFILPGLFAWVLCSLAFWYLFALYQMQAGSQNTIPILEKSPLPI